jgi:pyruvate kinase
MNAKSTSSMTNAEHDASLLEAASALLRLEQGLRALAEDMRASIDGVPAEHRESARNLVHYVALRQIDLRDLQSQLSELGLSSLGRSESCVLGSLLEVSLRAHESLALGGHVEAQCELERLKTARQDTISWELAQTYLHEHSSDMFGPRPADRHIYVMVTAPPAEEATLEWMAKLLNAGMNVLRINCAHDGEEGWAKMIDALARAREQTGKACRILMDLAGPKIRTGAISHERRIATWKPTRDDIGVATAPARISIRRASAGHREGVAAMLSMQDKQFAKLRKGDELTFRDARDKKRSLVVEEVDTDELTASALERAYVLDQTDARWHRGKEHKGHVTLKAENVSDAAIDVKANDTLVLTGRDTEGFPPRRDRDGRIEKPGVIACSLPAALEHLERGHRVLFDDGKIHAVVERVDGQGEFLLRIVHAQKEITKLHAAKGINLPDTLIEVPALSDDDRRALAFVVKHADAVSLSFVRTAEDVRALHLELDRLERPDIGIVLKLETRAGFESLPRILLEALQRPPLAVMIARGDLAVEVGFERLAELQEEMLWLCEASHVPAIWATQVLDTLARTGVPSRAEVTDAAAGVASECVMLNKGPFVDQAVAVLCDILRRMEKHRYKKRSLFRKLEVSSFTSP